MYSYLRYFVVFLFFLASLLYFFWLPPSQNINTNEIQSLKNHIDYQIKKTHQEIESFLPQLRKQGMIALQAKEFFSSYPYFVFQNGRLRYWTDYHVVPEYAEVKGNYNANFRRLSQGDFIICKNIIVTEEDSVEVFSLLPLSRHYKINNQYLQSGIQKSLFLYDNYKISGFQNNTLLNIYSPKKEFLFGIISTGSLPRYSFLQFLSIAICLTIAWILVGIQIYLSKKIYEQKLLYLLLWFGIADINIIYFNIFSWIFDSFFVLISIFFVLIFLLKNYRKTWTWEKLLQMKGCFYCERTWFPVFLSLLLANCLGYEWIIRQIFSTENINLDITKNLDFSTLTLLGWGLFALASIVFFMAWHLLLRPILSLYERHLKVLHFESYIFWILNICFLLMFFLLGKYGFWIGSYLLVSLWILTQKLPKQLYKLNYASSIYLFVVAAWASVVCVYALHECINQKNKDEKRNFATRILPENDAPTEQNLQEIIKNIQKDTTLKQALADTAQNFKRWSEMIKKQYLQNNFNKYEVNVLIFDGKTGNILSNKEQAEGNFVVYQKNYKNILFSTDNPNIWFIDKGGVNVLKRYVSFIEIKQKNQIIAQLIFDLKLKRTSLNYVFPELLVEKNYQPNTQAKNYSYALYEDSVLIYNSGEFNYDKDFSLALFRQENLFLKGIIHKNYQHLAVAGGLKKRVLVSAPAIDFNDYFSNFSFFFLGLILIIFAILTIITLLRGQYQHAKFSTRIQIYLNIAFFLPLFTVSLTTWSILQNTYKEDFEKTFALQTESLARNIAPFLQNFKEQKNDKEVFTQQLQSIAQYAESDINVFDETGRLLSSSRPAIFENEILSKYINPKALREIKNQRNKQVVLAENAGNLLYQSVYAPIKYVSSDKVQLNGIVSIPFFEAQTNLQAKSLGILSIILNIFTGIFLIFLILSYFASQVLTLPLRLVTQQIRKTTFQNYSEALQWDTKDEIGVFVEEYNKMLKKLDNSKENLARNQKEDAWREIAQQVAHEIKNPLTPMKLSLQMMQRRMEDQGDTVRNLFERSVETLLHQVEILDDIASSFSAFAKMPIPLSERFEIAQTLKNTSNLYLNQENLTLKIDIKQGKFFVRGDEKLVGRIFVNLIKNAIEAMPEDRNPEIVISLIEETEGLILIKVKDNGLGIPEEIGEKIFAPNFTTKSTGSGIGLAVAKRGIEHAGGRIWFETVEEEGTTFLIELPLVE